jgi:hypothetical protein
MNGVRQWLFNPIGVFPIAGFKEYQICRNGRHSQDARSCNAGRELTVVAFGIIVIRVVFVTNATSQLVHRALLSFSK